MKTKSETYTVGSVAFTSYDKFPAWVGPAPTAIDLARLYDRAAAKIDALTRALKLCAALTPRAIAAKCAALEPDDDQP